MSEEHPIRVLVVEDHEVVREGLCAVINSWPDLEVVGEAADGLEAVQKARSLQPDVILMDLVMPRKGGIEAISEIVKENRDARVLVLTSFSDDDRVPAAIQAGAIGYLLKDSSSRELVEAIFDVYQGKHALHPTAARTLVRQLRCPTGQRLTLREEEVLKLVARGLSNRGIAEELCLSQRTVARHISSLLGKLALENRTQAALYAIRAGLVAVEQD